MTMTESENQFDELLKYFTEDYIRNAGELIYKYAREFFESQNLKGKVYFNEDIFQSCLLDILVDIARLKYFHDIEYVNEVKLTAYVASWFIKRKPFQLIEDTDKDYIYINEQFALSLLLNEVNSDSEKEYLCSEENKHIENFKQIFYHLKYRNTNPQVLELFLIGVKGGIGLR